MARTPREQNSQADALSNEEFHEFDPALRLDLDPAAMDWVVLHEMIEARGGLAKELEERKQKRREERKAAREKKKKRKLAADQALRNRDPMVKRRS